MTELTEPSDYVQRKVRAMSQSIVDACVQHFETGAYGDDDLCAAFHALRDVLIVLISKLPPADQQEIVRILLKDSEGWPALAEEINARDRERLRLALNREAGADNVALMLQGCLIAGDRVAEAGISAQLKAANKAAKPAPERRAKVSTMGWGRSVGKRRRRFQH
jgi:hypothetical protein